MRRRRGIQLAAAASIVVIFTLGISGPVSGGESPRNPSRWDWLGAQGGTYWYVPQENLEAFRWQLTAPQDAPPIGDQTVWHIERYENGYFFGPLVVQFLGLPRLCQYLIGSVTPDGRVYISFNAVEAIPAGTPSLTTGFGHMARADGGAWSFTMQMASGSSSSQVTHWASMQQCTPRDACWTDLPGVGGSLLGLLAGCSGTAPSRSRPD